MSNENHGGKKKLLIGIVAVVSVAAVGGGIFLYMNSSSAAMRRKIIAETDHFQVTAAMYSCYFRQCADSYLSYAESNSELSVFDSDVSLREQNYSEDQTWFDLFMDNTMNTVQTNLQICEAAYTAGFELDAEQLERCETIVDNDDLSRYPDGVRREDLLEATKVIILAEQYKKKYNADITVTDAEIESYFQANKADYLTASVLAYTFPWSPEGMLTGDLTEYDMVTTAAKELSECKTERAFTDYVYRYLTKKKDVEREEAEQIASGLVITRFMRDFPENVRSWIEGGAKAGETEEFRREEQCYTSVYMLRNEPKVDDSRTVDFRVIYLSAADYDGADQAAEFANELREQIEAAGGTSEAFAEQAYEYSADGATYASGGLVRGYSASRTTYGDEISAWAFDNSRKQGDMTVIERSGAVLLAYFEAVNDETSWQNQIRSDLYQNKVEAFSTECEQYAVSNHEQNYQYLDF